MSHANHTATRKRSSSLCRHERQRHTEKTKGHGKPCRSNLLEGYWDCPDHGDKTFLISTVLTVTKVRSGLDFYRMGSGRVATVETLADGTYRTASSTVATLYTVHAVICGVSFPVFMTLPNEKEAIFGRAFGIIKRFMNAFTETSVGYVDYQIATINTLRGVFRCAFEFVCSAKIRLCGEPSQGSVLLGLRHQRISKVSCMGQAIAGIVVPDRGRDCIKLQLVV